MHASPSSDFRILVVGPLPPPVNGMILVTQAVLEDLRERYAIVVHNVAPGEIYRRFRPAGVLVKFVRFLALWLRLPWLRARGCKVLYMPLDSGSGQIFNLVTIGLARLLGQRTVLHHHVVNYLVQHSRLMAAVNRLTTSRDIQVFNCKGSAAKFAETYAQRSLLCPVSNSAFVDLDVKAVPSPPRNDRTLRLGHMSLLTIEKGIEAVFRLMETLLDRGVDVSLVVAGPVYQPAAAEALAHARKRFGDRIDYRGPVGGLTKQRFFDDIDVFVFPTTYAKESEPLVLIESLTSGVPVISYRRGCIGEIIGETGGKVVAIDGDFVAEAADLCARYAADPQVLAQAKDAATARARVRLTEAMVARDDLMRRMGPDGGG